MDYNYILEQCQHGNEIWKDILGYEGKYQVSNMGRVKSLDRSVIDKKGRNHITVGRIMKPVADKQTGHMRIGL